MGDVGSVAIGTWIVRIVLPILIVQALIEQKYRTAGVAAVLGLVGWLVLRRINAGLITPFLALLEIGLVLVVLGRDIRLN